MDGMGTLGYDCLIIPNAMNSKVTKFAAGGSEFCGRALADGLDTAGAAKTTEDAAATVCSKYTYAIDEILKIHLNSYPLYSPI